MHAHLPAKEILLFGMLAVTDMSFTGQHSGVPAVPSAVVRVQGRQIWWKSSRSVSGCLGETGNIAGSYCGQSLFMMEISSFQFSFHATIRLVFLGEITKYIILSCATPTS